LLRRSGGSGGLCAKNMTIEAREGGVYPDFQGGGGGTKGVGRGREVGGKGKDIRRKGGAEGVERGEKGERGMCGANEGRREDGVESWGAGGSKELAGGWDEMRMGIGARGGGWGRR